jgi:hypothetical protein
MSKSNTDFQRGRSGFVQLFRKPLDHSVAFVRALYYLRDQSASYHEWATLPDCGRLNAMPPPTCRGGREGR